MKPIQTIYTIILTVATMVVSAQEKRNSIGIVMAEVKPGSFFMGSAKGEYASDEKPVHKVNITYPYRMSITEVTNAQYELFDPKHAEYRGRNGFSSAADEAVVFVSWHEAVEYCKWLSKKEGKTYRLPTEAEWEYAARAGSYTSYTMGNNLPEAYLKNQEASRIHKPVSLSVAKTPANRWGLYDMHGNVEEWCYDIYGPYSEKTETDPIGVSEGYSRVTRGGSHNTPVNFLRSANRMAMIAEDKHWLTGFRLVEAPMPTTSSTDKLIIPRYAKNVSQHSYKWDTPSNKPIFTTPQEYVKKPMDGITTIYSHNHCPAITWCPNGDLIVIWFSCDYESGREMTILASRLRAGADTWDAPSEFFKIADRNMTGSSLLTASDGTIYHFNGVEAAGDWQNLITIVRKSTDNGRTWSNPQIMNGIHERGNQIIAGAIETSDGTIIQPCDAVAESHGGSVLQISRDGGNTWSKTGEGKCSSDFNGKTEGSVIAGIHAGVVELKSGELMAFGRGDHAKDAMNNDRMPCSISRDGGKSWSYSATDFNPIGGGQRLILKRLNSGELLFIGFTNYDAYTPDMDGKGVIFTKENGSHYEGFGMYAAISNDDGKTWGAKKIITDGIERYLDGGAWTKGFVMNERLAEPRAYLAVTQTPDGMIHLVSSKQYYKFNIEWLRKL